MRRGDSCPLINGYTSGGLILKEVSLSVHTQEGEEKSEMRLLK